MTGRVVVAGLGPGAAGHVTAETLAEARRIPHRILRTARHPSAHLIGPSDSCDDLYETADRFEDVYAEIVQRVVDAADEHGEVMYAVPGSPLVLERSVAGLRADPRVDTVLLPAMSFLDVAWARLGVDPVEAGVTLVDGHRFALDAAGVSGAVLVAHTHANWVLSEIKLALDDPSGGVDDLPVVLLHHLGLDDERLVETTWSEIDRTVDADHLTSLWIPDLAAASGAALVRFHELTRILRRECPWDREQTHTSLVPYLIEETYEVVDAVADLSDDPATDEALIEELGDLLYQIEFHAAIAEQEGRFTIADVAQGIHDKLIRRHPHVFAGVDVDGTADIEANWEAIKRAEKGRRSLFDGVPGSLPVLSYAHQLQRKAAKAGFDWSGGDAAAPSADLDAADIGQLLFALVDRARQLGVEPEAALRATSHEFRRRFEAIERPADTDGGP